MESERLLEECTCVACGSAMHQLSRAASSIVVAWCPVCHRVEARRRLVAASRPTAEAA